MDRLQLIKFASENEKLQQFARFLKRENLKYNLTAITGEEEIVFKHFYDSLAGANFLPQGANVCDIGSGAGFPVIPLALLREDCSFTGVDSTEKKVNFINAACAMLGISNCYAVHARAEDVCRSGRESFDVVTSRAVAGLSTLAEYCLPLLKAGGVMIAYKGSQAEEELKEAHTALQVLGGVSTGIYPYTLPTGEMRNLVIVEKRASTPEKYPRGGNKPRLKPIK